MEWPHPIWSVPYVGSLKRPKRVVHDESWGTPLMTSSLSYSNYRSSNYHTLPYTTTHYHTPHTLPSSNSADKCWGSRGCCVCRCVCCRKSSILGICIMVLAPLTRVWTNRHLIEFHSSPNTHTYTRPITLPLCKRGVIKISNKFKA